MMSEITSRPPTLDGEEKDPVADCFVTYQTSNVGIVVTLTYPGSWTATVIGEKNGYKVMTSTVLDVTTITFDFTEANYGETAVFTFTNSDSDGGTYQVTMGPLS
jgi:hypothetical protein